MHVMKLTIKGKSDKQAFTVAVSMESLIGFLTAAATKSEEQFDDDIFHNVHANTEGIHRKGIALPCHAPPCSRHAEEGLTFLPD